MKFKDLLKLRGFGWSLSNVLWQLDWDKPSKTWLKDYLDKNVFLAHVFLNNNQVPKFIGHRDDIVKAIYSWILENIEYKTDLKRFGKKEMWEDIDEVLDSKAADCESMSTLLFALARAHNVSPLQIRLVAGKVGVGHCWIEYRTDKSQKWQVYDCAMRTRCSAYDTKYKNKWFKVTDYI